MTPELQAYAETDTGYRQFCNQYDVISSDPQSRDKYVRWVLAQMKLEGQIETAKQLGYDEGKGRGIQQAHYEIANKMVRCNLPIEEIMEFTGLSREEIESM